MNNDTEKIDEVNLLFDSLINFREKIEISNTTWNVLEYCHKDYKELPEFRTVFKRVKTLETKTSGIYAYFAGKDCLYIGKAKSIRGRLESHWKASRKKNNSSRGQKHRKLFEVHLKKPLRVYFIELDDEDNPRLGEEMRRIIEIILHFKYRPEFERIKRNKETGEYIIQCK